MGVLSRYVGWEKKGANMLERSFNWRLCLSVLSVLSTFTFTLLYVVLHAMMLK